MGEAAAAGHAVVVVDDAVPEGQCGHGGVCDGNWDGRVGVH